jgi:hypothetical protein
MRANLSDNVYISRYPYALIKGYKKYYANRRLTETKKIWHDKPRGAGL